MNARSCLAIALLISCATAFGQGLVLKYRAVRPAGQAFQIMNMTGNYADRTSAWHDLDGNGSEDLVISPYMGGFTVYGMPGMNVLWQSPAASGSCPFFIDLDGDGIKEIFYQPDGGSNDHFAIYSMAHNSCIFNADSIMGSWIDEMFIADYDGDGLPDIMFNITGTAQWRFEVWGAGTVESSPPSGLIVNADSTDLLLNWQPVDSCSLYNIQWSLSINGPWASVGNSVLTTFMHPGAAIVPRAYYRVVAITSTYGTQIIGNAVYAPDNKH
jgi:hypothetical protein